MRLSWWNSDDVLALTRLLYSYFLDKADRTSLETPHYESRTLHQKNHRFPTKQHLKSNMSFLSKAEDQVEQSLDGQGQSGGQDQSQDQSQGQSGSGMEQKADSFVNNGECSFEPKKLSSLRSPQK